MKKNTFKQAVLINIIGLVILVGLTLFVPKRLSSSTHFTNDHYSSDLMVKKAAIYNVLQKYNSPLTGEIDAFLNACMTYNIDCYLLPSISGVESTFGRFLMPGSYNPFGWGGGHIYFESWEDGFNQVGKGLKENYFGQGLTSIEEVGSVYAASPAWPSKVHHYLSMFTAEEAKINLSILEL